jgi:uncharacterized membrane protein YraQ (UPF0718 family)
MLSIIILGIFTLLCLAISFFVDRKKTFLALKKAFTMFINLLPPFLTILILVSVFLFLVPKELMIKWLGKDSGIIGMIIAALIGSISLIPGFIAYPLGKILVQNGVTYSIIAIFITTLMMVGVVTLPIENKYFGFKVVILRNSLSFVGAIIIGILVGIIWRMI